MRDPSEPPAPPTPVDPYDAPTREIRLPRRAPAWPAPLLALLVPWLVVLAVVLLRRCVS